MSERPTARNKSIDEEKTRAALRYYYGEAKKTGRVKDITDCGKFLESAISTAILRGRISQKMIDAFQFGMGADPDVLIGLKDIPAKDAPGDKKDAPTDKDDMSDQEMFKILDFIVSTQGNSGNTSLKIETIRKIKDLLKDF